jgi:hypothetical protein
MFDFGEPRDLAAQRRWMAGGEWSSKDTGLTWNSLLNPVHNTLDPAERSQLRMGEQPQLSVKGRREALSIEPSQPR